jgi:excisionase family DNA binding protein
MAANTDPKAHIPMDNEHQLLTVNDVAEELQVCTTTVRHFLADNVIPSILVGRSRRVRRRELQAYIDGLDGTYIPVEWR